MQNKLVVNLKASQVREANQQKSDARFVRSFFREKDRIDAFLEAKAQAKASEAAIDWDNVLRYGECVSAPVQFAKDMALIVNLAPAAKAAASRTVTGIAMRPYHTAERDQNVQSDAERKAFRKAHNKAVRDKTAADSGAAMADDTEDAEAADAGSADAKSKDVKGQRTWSAGQNVRCRVLDVNREKGIVDVTLRDELGMFHPLSSLIAAVLPAVALCLFAHFVWWSFVRSVSAGDKAAKAGAKAAGKGLKMGETVPVVIQLVKHQYFVLSLPNHHHQIGFACASSYNLRVSPHSVFRPGYQCNAYVSHVPGGAGDDKVNRVLLVLDLNVAMAQHSAGSKTKDKENRVLFYDPEVKKKSEVVPGKTLKVKITGKVGAVRCGFHIASRQGGSREHDDTQSIHSMTLEACPLRPHSLWACA